jgi:hypothetical protein
MHMIFPAQYKAKLEFADRIRRGDAAAVRHLDELNAKFAHDVSGHVDLLEDPQWAPKPPPLPPDSIQRVSITAFRRLGSEKPRALCATHQRNR